MATGAVATLRKLWRHNRWLTLSFVITLTLALFFIIRASVFFIYWQNHADEPIEGWMTVRYVAHSYRVHPELVHNAIGLPLTGPDRRPLVKIAREDGKSLDAMTAAILQAINADRGYRRLHDGAPPPRPRPPDAAPPPAPATPVPPKP